jgi:signal transduction histidine kinase
MRRRVLLAILLAVAVTALALGIPLAFTAVRVVDSLTRDELVNRAQQIAATLDDEIAAGRRVDLAEVQLAVPPGGQVTLRTPSGGMLTHGPDPGTDVISEQVPILQEGWVRLSVPAGPTRTREWQATGFVLLLAVLSVGTGTVVATVTARRLAGPLREVADRAARLGAGDFRPDERRYRVRELDMVADALDTSAAALAQLVQRERDLVGDVSHQLRSRLTALQLRLEALAEYPGPDSAHEAAAALEQAERLAEVLDELLAAARAARSVNSEPVDLATELGGIVAEWRELLRAQGRGLRLRVPDGLLARATPARLRETVGVLLDNAVRHGQGQVTVAARRGEGTVVVEVSDSGPGVPDELSAHVFERGVSGGGSTGVGLALARALADADGGRLELSTARPATFALFLPVARAQDVVAVPWQSGAGPR